MSRLIDKGTLKSVIRKEFPDLCDRVQINNIVNEAPTVEKCKIGQWIYNANGESISEEWDCSECGQWTFEKTNYCPYCGAKMEDNNEID